MNGSMVAAKRNRTKGVEIKVKLCAVSLSNQHYGWMLKVFFSCFFLFFEMFPGLGVTTTVV